MVYASMRITFLLVAGYVASVAAFTGDATFFHVGVDFGACGQKHTDDQFVVALAFGTFDTYPGADTKNPNNNPICGKRLKATYKGKSVVVEVVDRCADCMDAGNIDFSPAAFDVLADQSEGRLHGVEWEWTDLPAGPGGGGSSEPPEQSTPVERRSKLLGRRKPLGAVPTKPIVARAPPIQPSPVTSIKRTTDTPPVKDEDSVRREKLPSVPRSRSGEFARELHQSPPRMVQRRRSYPILPRDQILSPDMDHS